MNNKDNYIKSMDKIKADEQLVSNTIEKIKSMQYENNVKIPEFQPTTKTIKLKHIMNWGMGIAATFLITITCISAYKNIQPQNEIYSISGIETNVNSEKEVKYIELNDYLNSIEINNINENKFSTICFASKLNNQGELINYKMTGKYKDFEKTIELLKQCSKLPYILNENNNVDMSKYMCIIITGYCKILVPEDTTSEIIIIDNRTENSTVCTITLDEEDATVLKEIRSLIEAGGIIEEEPNIETNENINNIPQISNDFVSTSPYGTLTLKNGELSVKFNLQGITNRDYVEPLDVSKINESNEYIISKNVKTAIYTFVGKEDWPIVFYILQDGTIQYVKYEEAIINGNFDVKYNVDCTEKPISLVMGQGSIRQVNSEFGYSTVFAITEDINKIELEINELFE